MVPQLTLMNITAANGHLVLMDHEPAFFDFGT